MLLGYYPKNCLNKFTRISMKFERIKNSTLSLHYTQFQLQRLSQFRDEAKRVARTGGKNCPRAAEVVAAGSCKGGAAEACHEITSAIDRRIDGRRICQWLRGSGQVAGTFPIRGCDGQPCRAASRQRTKINSPLIDRSRRQSDIKKGLAPRVRCLRPARSAPGNDSINR